MAIALHCSGRCRDRKLQHNSHIGLTATASPHLVAVFQQLFLQYCSSLLQHAARCKMASRSGGALQQLLPAVTSGKNKTINGGDGSWSQKQLRFNGNSVNVAAAFQHLLLWLCSMQWAIASGSGGVLKQVLPAVMSGKAKAINGGNGSCSQTVTWGQQQQHCCWIYDQWPTDLRGWPICPTVVACSSSIMAFGSSIPAPAATASQHAVSNGIRVVVKLWSKWYKQSCQVKQKRQPKNNSGSTATASWLVAAALHHLLPWHCSTCFHAASKDIREWWIFH